MKGAKHEKLEEDLRMSL